MNTTKCPECQSSMTELNDVFVCDNQSCGYNLEKKCTHESRILASDGLFCADCAVKL